MCSLEPADTYTAHAIFVRSVSMYAEPVAWLISPGCKTLSWGYIWNKIVVSIILTNKSVWCLRTPCLFSVWWIGFAKDRTVLRRWRQVGGFLLVRLFFFDRIRVVPLYTGKATKVEPTREVLSLNKIWVWIFNFSTLLVSATRGTRQSNDEYF